EARAALRHVGEPARHGRPRAGLDPDLERDIVPGVLAVFDAHRSIRCGRILRLQTRDCTYEMVKIWHMRADFCRGKVRLWTQGGLPIPLLRPAAWCSCRPDS